MLLKFAPGPYSVFQRLRKCRRRLYAGGCIGIETAMPFARCMVQDGGGVTAAGSFEAFRA
jgi:hypothetical protein